MAKRVLLAALLGGLTLFMWGFVSHVVIGLGDKGVHSVPLPPGDQALLDSIASAVPEDGMFLFPGIDQTKRGDAATMQEWTERTKTSPRGLMIVHHTPYGGMSPQLATELGTDVGLALVAAILLAMALGSCRTFACRAGFVALLSLVAALRPIQQWNWYEFPCEYACAQVLDGVIGFTLVGIVLALIVKPKA